VSVNVCKQTHLCVSVNVCKCDYCIFFKLINKQNMTWINKSIETHSFFHILSLPFINKHPFLCNICLLLSCDFWACMIKNNNLKDFEKILDPSETCFSRFLTTDRYLGILRYLCLCILFVSIKSKLLKSQDNRRQIL
jgi:hypothetical protein